MSILNSDQEVIQVADLWLTQGYAVYLVTVVKTWGSSPRPVGSIAAVRQDGELVGSVSGGCVEKQLVQDLLRSKKDSVENDKTNHDGINYKIATHLVDDEQARRFGLSCGGQLELVFERFSNASSLKELALASKNRQPLIREVDLTTGIVSLDKDRSHLIPFKDREPFYYDGSILRKVFGPAWRILIIGAGQLSRYTAEFALSLDYEVLVCDPRPGFKQAWQVEEVDVIDMSPDDAVLKYARDENSAVLALTHDPNLDDLALLEALPSSAFYVGALGSVRNYEKRKHRLADLGLKPQEINRLVGPIGLDIGSKTSAEIAISIIAHLIQVRSLK